MIAFYRRLTRDCATVNQLNRVHIALENRITPLEWSALAAAINPASSVIEAVREGQARWLQTMGAMFAKAGKAEAEPYRARRLARHIKWFGAQLTPAARTLVVCFTGQAQRMMSPLPVFLQHFSAVTEDVVVINYPKGLGFRYGLQGVAEGFENFLDALGALLPLAGYERVVAIGVSGGALPAIAAAQRLGFDAAAGFGAGYAEDPRWIEALGFSLERLLRPTDDQAPPLPVTLVYGAEATVDKDAAARLAQVIPVNQAEVFIPGKPVGHNALYPLLMTRQLRPFLEDSLLAPRPPRLARSVAPHAYARTLTPLEGPRFVCVGFNKTGTTTLGRCFEALGIGPVAEPRSPHVNYLALSDDVLKRSDVAPVLDAARYFRAFQDRPWNVGDVYQKLDQLYPDSRFILTEREPESWWRSVEQWLGATHRGDRGRLARYLDHLKVDALDKNKFIDAYLAHSDRIKAYFAGRTNLLVMDLAAGDGWKKLCEFLEMPVPDQPFPHANRQEKGAS
ncbi:MAG: hypothetical protein J0L81_09900 [Caulobacterales bacterium]|nr:hypothetical protein [Caulobacterales bacterium]